VNIINTQKLSEAKGRLERKEIIDGIRRGSIKENGRHSVNEMACG
jgi:hypothetical protein